MADIYVRPYGGGGKRPWKKIFAGILILLLAAAGFRWFLAGRPDQEQEHPPAQQQDRSRAQAERPPAVSPPALRTPGESSGTAEQLFAEAQRKVSDGQLREAGELFDRVLAVSADPGLRTSAWRVQGRINMDLFLSDVPGPEKKTYVIQPGDSLDRIARRNKTTIDLIRRMNGIEGSLIYPGTRILLPAEPLRVEVSKSDRTLDVLIGEKRLKRYAVGVGRDNKTPAGNFKTGVHQINPDWTPPGGGIIPFGDPRNELGTRWISIHDSTRPELRGFGIHGTSDRESIGVGTSNGCVRMLNEDVEQLYMLIPPGTDVLIRE